MGSVLNGRLPRLIALFFRSAPLYVLLAMALKVSFLVVQLGSIWLIFYWVTGNVPSALVEKTGVPVESYFYAFLGAGLLFLSSLLGLASRFVALKATLRLEKVILAEVRAKEFPLLPGDLKNIVKVMLSLIDITVPVLLIIAVIVCWSLVLPYSLLAVLVLLVIGFVAIRSGVGYSAGKYRRTGKRVSIAEYLSSNEHISFYRVLLLPNYISMVIFGVISISIVLSVYIARQYFDGGSWYTDLLMIATAITFLQMRSFAGIIQRVGAYSDSLAKIDKILLPRIEENPS